MGLTNFILECEKDNEQLRNDINYYKNFNKRLQQENKILKENAENNDKVVDKVNWENQLLKKEIHQLKEQLESSEKARKEAIEFIKSKEYVIDFSTFGYELNNYEIFKLKNILDIDKGE